MTALLEKAFEEATKLPEPEQDALARWIIAELESELRWQQLFADSQDLLAELAEEALVEHQAGQTQPLDPDTL